MFRECCCTFIPNNTAPDGSFTQVMNRLKGLRQEVKENARFDKDWFSWFDLKLEKWGAMLMKVGTVTLLCSALTLHCIALSRIS
ncbi:hypothetical protein LDENG_00039890 [Lucifuga dentata]|nr:hypothetical protein LDENG_00039890 [Lucifuga dentata]